MGDWGRVALAIVICAVLHDIRGNDDSAKPSECFNGCFNQPHGSNVCSTSLLDCLSPMGTSGERKNEIIVTSVKVVSLSQSNYSINIQWQLKEGIENVEGFVTRVRDPINSSDDVCQNILRNHSIPNGQNQITFNLCLSEVIPNATIPIEITSLPGNKITQVILQLPPSLENAVEEENPFEWIPVLAAVVDDKSRQVTVISSPVPANLSVTGVWIDAIYRDTYINRTKLASREPRCTFSVNETSTAVTISVKLTSFAEGCEVGDGCQQILLPGIKLSASPTPVPPPTTTPKTTTPVPTIPVTPRPRPKTPALTTTTTTPHHPTDPSVIVKPAAEQKEFQRNIKIIVGTVLGFGSLAAIVVVGCFCVYRRRSSNHSSNFVLQRFGRRRGSDTSSLTDALDKQLPIVLLLYSYDCPAHERVVIQFANFLQFVANCEVLFDVWDQHQVASQGMHSWFQDKLDVAQFVIIICSTGARFKCARNRQQQTKQERPIPDLFAWAVDQIGESMRKGKLDVDSYLRYLVVNFEYSSQSDIPPKLDTAFKFCLMKDIFNLYCHLQCMKIDSSPEGNSYDGVTEDTWYKTDCGQGLLEAIKDAKQFFLENPDWLAQTLEPMAPALPPGSIQPEDSSAESRSARPKKKFRSSRSRSFSSSSERDILHEQQQKKRQKKESKLRKTQSSHNSIDSPIDSRHESPLSSQGPSSSSSASSSSPLMLNSTHDKVLNKQIQPLPPIPSHGPVQRSFSQPETAYQSLLNPRKPKSMGSLQRMGSTDLDLEEEESEMDEFQLKKDIDFIQNFDARSKNASVGSLDPLNTLEVRGYSPTESFMDLNQENRGSEQNIPFTPRRFQNPYLVIDFDLHQQPSNRGSPSHAPSVPSSNGGSTSIAIGEHNRPQLQNSRASQIHSDSPERPYSLPLGGGSRDLDVHSSPSRPPMDIRKGSSDPQSPGPQPLSPVALSSNTSSQSSKTSSPLHLSTMPGRSCALSSNSAVLNPDLSALSDFTSDVTVGYSNGSPHLSQKFSV